MRPHNFGPHACSVQSMRPSNTLSHLYVYNHWHSLGGRWTGALDFIMQCARPNHNLHSGHYMYNSQLLCMASAMLAKVISPAAPGGPAKAFLFFPTVSGITQYSPTCGWPYSSQQTLRLATAASKFARLPTFQQVCSNKKASKACCIQGFG